MRTENMTQQESLTLIAEMIKQTKRRYSLEDGNSFLVWGYLSVVTCIVTEVVGLITQSPWAHMLWFFIPILGFAYTIWSKRGEEKGYVQTYTDRIVNRTWSIVGYSAWVLSVICGVFHYFTSPAVWGMMMIYAFLIVGLGVLFTGIVLEEKSLMFGGCVGALCGVILICAFIVDIHLSDRWVLLMYILSFTLMMIVPGHIIRAKARRQLSV